MTRKLSIDEKYSQHWPVICGVSLILAVILFLSYQTTSNVLLEGYLRLASFGFLALSILSYFKVRDGKVVVDFEMDDEGALKINYSIRENYIHSEEWTVSEIAEAKIDELPNRSVYNDIMKKDRCVRLRRKKETDWIYFNKVYGRVIPLTQQNAEKIKRFISEKIKS